MKNTLKLFAFLALFMPLSVFADKDRTAETSNFYIQQFHQTIKSNLFYPEDLKQDGLNGFVLVSFKVNNYGMIEILEINGNHSSFIRSAKDSLSRIKLCSFASDTDRIYNMRFNYNLY